MPERDESDMDMHYNLLPFEVTANFLLPISGLPISLMWLLMSCNNHCIIYDAHTFTDTHKQVLTNMITNIVFTVVVWHVMGHGSLQSEGSDQ